MSLTILQAEKAELVAELKELKQTFKKIGTDMQPQFQLKLFAAEKLITEKDKEIAKYKKEHKDQLQEEKSEEKEENSDGQKYNAYLSALEVYESTQMCFHKNSTPRYFYKKEYNDTHRITKQALTSTEILFFTAGSMYPNWVQLKSPLAQSYLRQMIEGGTLSVKEPEKDELSKFTFPTRVYTKLGNTRHTPDPETYNLIDLTGVMKPNGEELECPPVIKALLLALSGNLMNEDGTLPKPENLDWLEKWLYGVLYADIGNNMLPMPVFFGPGKVGKNAMFDVVFPLMLGKQLCFSGTWDTVDSNFNGFKVGKVFMFIDEVPPREEWDKLKNLTGSPTDYVKEKYGPEFIIDNTVAPAIGTNQSVYPLPFEGDKQMMRVSPIAVNGRATFAENTVKILDSLLGAGKCLEMLKDNQIDVSTIEHDNFMIGDTLLRQFPELWQGKEVLQQFLNYLDTKYKTEKYTLAPLRGQDWREIAASKKTPITQTVEYIIDRDVQVITVNEAHEIYKVLLGDNKKDQFVKQMNNFSTELWVKLEEQGYLRKQQCRVLVEPTSLGMLKNNQQGETGPSTVQTTVFYKEGQLNSKHTENVNVYIVEVRTGTTNTRRLKYE